MLCLTLSIRYRRYYANRTKRDRKRPADVIGAAVKIAKIADGWDWRRTYFTEDDKDKAAQTLGRKGGKSQGGESDGGEAERDCEEGGGGKVEVDRG